MDNQVWDREMTTKPEPRPSTSPPYRTRFETFYMLGCLVLMIASTLFDQLSLNVT